MLYVPFAQVVLAGEKRIPALVAHQANQFDLRAKGFYQIGVQGLLRGEKNAEFHM